jgi:nucleoside-diphosphate-sugar epimerase
LSGIVLLTGSTGFVGRQVLASLLRRGISVRVVVRDRRRLPTGADGLEGIIETPDAFGEQADWWARASAGVTTVVHAAWYAEPGKYQQSPLNLDCLAGTLQLAKGAVAAGVHRFVGIGSCAEYDLTEGDVSENTPLNPTTPYSAAKAAAYMVLSQWLPAQKVQFAWCRLFYMYGEGEDSARLVPFLRARLAAGEVAELTSGTQVRDFMDVADVGRAVVDIALGEEEGAVNVCSGIPITVRELAERIADEYGRRDLLRFGARPDNNFDPPRVVGVRRRMNGGK